MKKVLVFLLACLSGTMMFGAITTHYSSVGAGTANTTTKFNCVIVIDGVEQGNPNYELAAFDQNGICRGAKMPFQYSGRYIYAMQLRGNENDPTFYYDFKVYDHESESDLDVEMAFNVEWNGTTYTQIYYQGNITMGNAANPLNADFVSSSTGYTLEIDAYTSDKDHYYLIASPVGAISASAVEGLRTPNFDFYSFNPGQNLEWDYLGGEEDAEYMLQPGKGYLYANSTGTDLVFNGTPLEGETFELALTTAAAADGLDFPNWNLVGNPFEVVAYPNAPFYTLNPETGAYIANDANAALPAMNGAFVYNGETAVTFNKTQGSKAPMLALNLSSNGKALDRAIVSFGQGQQLPKLQFRDNSTKVYIPMDGNDYALVRSEGMGEMPVSFKAEANGTYSLTLSSENADFAYLHLIDNLTGADQDLLANPSYSFSANTTDYASRFRLVFATGNDEENFAFFSNGSLFVNNEGNATLQVVDVTGRIIKCESINGCANVNINAASGVYMVRLVNGDNVKVQKVVK